ncbi:unnamed protein product [Caenorhabditis brenneri]
MSGRTFPKKNSGKMNRERRYGRGGRDEEGHNGYYDGNQEYCLGGQIRGGGERREEKGGWNRGGAGRDSEDRPSTHRQRDPRYGDYSRRSHRSEGNGGDQYHGHRRSEDRGYGRNRGNVSRYDGDMNGVRGNRRIQHENRSSHHSREQHESPRLPPRTQRGNTPPPAPVELAQRSSSRVSPPSREKQDGPKVARLRKQMVEGSVVNGGTGGSGVATPNNEPPRQQPLPPPRRQPPLAPAIAALVPRRGQEEPED